MTGTSQGTFVQKKERRYRTKGLSPQVNLQKELIIPHETTNPALDSPLSIIRGTPLIRQQFFYENSVTAYFRHRILAFVLKSKGLQFLSHLEKLYIWSKLCSSIVPVDMFKKLLIFIGSISPLSTFPYH